MQQNRFKRDGRVFKCQTFGTIHSETGFGATEEAVI